MKRSARDKIDNVLLLKFLMEYSGKIDANLFDRAIASLNPQDLPPDVMKVISDVEALVAEVEAITQGQREGKDTQALEEALLRKLIADVEYKARFAIERSSVPEIAGLVPHDLLFQRIGDKLKEFGGGKLAALLALAERQRNFDESLKAGPKPPKF